MWFVDRGRFNLWAMSWAEYAKILAARRGKEGKAAEAAEKKATVEELQVLCSSLAPHRVRLWAATNGILVGLVGG